MNLKITETLEESANGFLILDAIFLSDALRRLKKEFAKNKKFEENRQVMYLHMFIIIGHSFVMVASAIVMSQAVLHNNRSASTILLAYGVQVTTQSLAQGVLLYLFTKLSEPIQLETEDEEIDESL